MTKTLTINETAIRLNIAPQTVYVYVTAGRLTGANGAVDLASVLAYEQQQAEHDHKRIRNLDQIKAVLTSDDGLTDRERGYVPGGRLPTTGLTELERKVLNMRARDKATYAQIGDAIGVGRERVRQIINRAVDRLLE